MIIFVYQFLHQAIQKLIDLLARHILQLLAHLLGALRVEHLAVQNCVFKRTLQVFERVLIEFAEAHVRVVEPAVEKKIRQGFEQIFGAETEVLPGVAPVANGLH